VLADLQREFGASLQVLGVTFAAEEKIPEFLARFSPPFPVGPAPRGQILEWLGVDVDDGKQLPRLVILDAKGGIKGSYGWQHSIFQDPAKEPARIREAVMAASPGRTAR
jgi:hypothetical protein